MGWDRVERWPKIIPTMKSTQQQPQPDSDVSSRVQHSLLWTAKAEINWFVPIKIITGRSKTVTILEDRPIPIPKSKMFMYSSITCFIIEVYLSAVSFLQVTQSLLKKTKPQFKYILIYTIPMITDLFQILHVTVTNFLQRILSNGTGVYQVLIPRAIPWFNTLFYTFYNFLIMRRGYLCSIFPINLV